MPAYGDPSSIPGYQLPGERPGEQPTRVQISGIPDGYAGTRAVLDVMAGLVNGSFSDERIAQIARHATMNCPARDDVCEARACLDFIRSRFRYTRLPSFNGMGLQRLQTPAYTLLDPAAASTGECASLSVALAALMKSLGIETGFRVCGRDANQPLEYEHVYCVIRTPDGVVPLDPSYNLPIGGEHPAIQTREDYWIP